MKKDFSDFNIDISNGDRTLCPECSKDRKKSNIRCLKVDIEEGIWFCHHCGWAGGLLKKSEFKKSTFKKVVFKKPIPIKSGMGKNEYEFFASRGISKATIDRVNISSGKIFMPQEDAEVNAINFPYYRDGVLINIKSRDGKKNFRLSKGAERIIYGLDDINEFTTVITEGEIDKLSCDEAGFINSVSVPDGAPDEKAKNYQSKFDFLKADENKIGSVLKWVIAVDQDAPGVKLKNELIRRLGSEKCYVAEFPLDCKDANDVLIKHGASALVKCIENAQPVPVSGLFNVEDFKTDILDAYKYGYKKGELPGWDNVDELYSARSGEWTLITGIPASGKSEWLDAMLVNMAKANGSVFGILSMENLPLERHFGKLAEKFIGKPFEDKISAWRMPEEDLNECIDWVGDHFNFMVPDENDMTIDGILKLAKILCYREGINGLVIDPWNELDHSLKTGETETEHISKCLSKIRRFARENDIHIWVVAHPTKLQKGKDGKYPVPTPYDVAGSAHWRNKADNSITVHRPNVADFKDKRVEIHVQKIRFKEIGRVGVANLMYNYETGTYYEPV